MKKTYVKPSLKISILDNSDIISLSSTKLQSGKYTNGDGVNVIDF
ncbi:MAG: hypothetical protein Q4D26_05620 [Clostridia bacterium]|nr:hypothetical protein [Clostridia bacterium]